MPKKSSQTLVRNAPRSVDNTGYRGPDRMPAREDDTGWLAPVPPCIGLIVPPVGGQGLGDPILDYSLPVYPRGWRSETTDQDISGPGPFRHVLRLRGHFLPLAGE